MKKLFILLLAAMLLFSGCTAPKTTEVTEVQSTQQPELTQYNSTFLSLFDTVTTVLGKAESEEVFNQRAEAMRALLEKYHQLFDIYSEYEGINNLKTINDMAGKEPVKVDGEIIRLLKDCKAFYEATGGKVNVAMGSVLKIWHEVRSVGRMDPENAVLPDMEELQTASQYTDFDQVLIDEEASTVFIADPNVRLDVGAVAKGWSVQRVIEQAPEGMLISVGGNVAASGPKDPSGTPWIVGVENPEGGSGYLNTLNLTRGCVVTNGDYQRTYVVDGKYYHHIIDPATLFPATLWRSVTIAHDDSGEADALSTALFILPLEEGKALLKQFGAEALWVNAAGEKFYSDGFDAYIRQ